MRNPVLLGEIARWFNDVQRRRAKGFCGHRSSELDTDKTMLEPDFDPAPTAVQIGRCGYPMPCLVAAKKNAPQRNAAGVRTDQAQRAFQGQCWQDTLLAGRANHDFLRVKGVKGENMRTRTVALLILICWFVLAPGLLRAADNEWYQGQQGQWQRHGKQSRWESTHGDDWYQGQQGHWYNEPDGWRWLGNNGDEYRKRRNGWAWAYRNRNPKTDRRTFQQFKEQQ